jgi:hypothetical protein
MNIKRKDLGFVADAVDIITGPRTPGSVRHVARN